MQAGSCLQQRTKRTVFGQSHEQGAACRIDIRRNAVGDRTILHDASGNREVAKTGIGRSVQAYPPSWFNGRLTSLQARWFDLNSPLVSNQLSLAL